MPPYFIDSVRGVAVGDASHCFPMGKDGGKNLTTSTQDRRRSFRVGLKEGCSSHRCYPIHDITPKVPAIAVRMAMIILSICFQSISFMFV